LRLSEDCAMPLRLIGIHLLFLLSLPLLAQDSQKQAPGPNKLYEFRDDHDPNGIGKFYMGREIANVMSHLGAGWLERHEREKEEHTSKLLPPLKVKPGDVVADIGARSGYYTLKLAERVGPKGKDHDGDLHPATLPRTKHG